MKLCSAFIICTMLIITSARSAVVDAARPAPPHPVPPDLVIDELRETYSQLFAEEVVVRYRGPQAAPRSEMYIVRVDPGPDPALRPARVFLELGPLRILFADNQMIVVSKADPDHYFRQAFEGPITPELAARLLPPLPLPHLSLAAAWNDMLRAPTPYTPDIIWTSGVLDPESRPAIARLTGAGSNAEAMLLVNADNIQLMQIAVQIRAAPGAGGAAGGGIGEAQMQLTMRAVDPGDPATWRIDTSGREPVTSLAELRPVARPRILSAGERVPDMGFTTGAASPWSLYSALRGAAAVALPGEEPAPVALILVRLPADFDDAESRLQRAGLALRALRRPDSIATSQIAVAGITTLADYSRDRWEAARATWGTLADPARYELLAGHAPTQTIDLFGPDAAVVLILIGADRSLHKALVLDGMDREEIAAAVRKKKAQDEPGPDDGG